MTGTICAVAICKSNSKAAKKTGEKISFFRFPNDPKIRKEWVRRCHRKDDFNPINKRICSKHFTSEDFEDCIKGQIINKLPIKLKSNAVPTKYLLPETVSNTGTECTSREQRMNKRKHKQIIEKLLEPETLVQPPDLEATATSFSETDSETTVEVLQQQLELIKNQNLELKKQLDEKDHNILLMKERNSELEKHIQNNAQDLFKEFENQLAHVFSKNQMDIVLKKKSRARWTNEEISKAFTLRYLSKRAYIYMRQKLHYPLPGISTLQRWAMSMDLQSGILKNVLTIMKSVGENLKSYEKVSVLSFDEVKISTIYEYDQSRDAIIGPYKYMQVVMARGLFHAWKQPVYIGFDSQMNKELLYEIITQLQEIQYDVVACVSDCGGGNMGLWKNLEISIDKTYCFHPVTSEKIFFFADMPHLLKLIRNWLIDHGFILKDDQIIIKDPLVALITTTSSEISSCHKLSLAHIKCEKAERQNVNLAAQLLSHTTATALKRYLPGNDKEMAQNVGNFIEMISQWFDLMNSYSPMAPISTKKPYGTDLVTQNNLLDIVKDTFRNMRCIGKNTLQIFQKGVIVSSQSLQDLLVDVCKRYSGVSYILTHRLNQDCLENFFSQIRTRGGLHDHPSPLNAIYRIRMMLLGKNPGIVQAHTNVEVTKEIAEGEYLTVSALKRAVIEVRDPVAPEVNDFPDNLSDISSASSTSSSSQKISENDGLVYIAGFLAKKFLEKYPYLGRHTHQIKEPIPLHTYSMPSWVQSLSFGGLIQPSQEWIATVKLMDKYFKKIHMEEFRFKEKIIFKTTKIMCEKLPNTEKELIEAFCRQRIFMRIKFLNNKKNLPRGLKRKGDDQQRKSTKKLRKLVS